MLVFFSPVQVPPHIVCWPVASPRHLAASFGLWLVSCRPLWILPHYRGCWSRGLLIVPSMSSTCILIRRRSSAIEVRDPKGRWYPSTHVVTGPDHLMPKRRGVLQVVSKALFLCITQEVSILENVSLVSIEESWRSIRPRMPLRVLLEVVMLVADLSKQMIMINWIDLFCPFMAASSDFGPAAVAVGLLFRWIFALPNYIDSRRRHSQTNDFLWYSCCT